MATADRSAATASAPLAVRMAHALAAYSFARLTPEVVAKAKLCVYDLLSSALSAGEQPWSRQAAAIARRNSQGSARGAGIIGTSDVVSTHDAAFANGVLSHGLVRDDMHVGSVSHLGTVLVPTLLAFSETTRASGKDFLTALVAGYEVGGKVGRMLMDVEVSKIFRPTGTVGPIAAAAAGAKLLGLTPQHTTAALALAANTAAGYNEWAGTGGSEMFFHNGLAARSAVTAVQLAAEGAYASPTALDGDAGILAAFRRPRPPNVPELFADRPEILAVFFKPVPACNFAQTPAQAALALAQGHRLSASDIDSVVARVTKAAALYPGCDVSGPFEHILQAKMSIQYNVAAALAHGNFAERNYVPQQNPEVQALAKRVRVEIDPGFTAAFPAKQGAAVIVRTRDDRTLEQSLENVEPTDPDGVHERFFAAASTTLGETRARELDALIGNLEHSDDAANLARLTRKG
ncbi:MAG TPA: MmgE/PrpD family protein [Gammaproteobacteria bacterium]|nr:MmgE/PrpD family protein [Gammaproteobacteria bacterium]